MIQKRNEIHEVANRFDVGDFDGLEAALLVVVALEEAPFGFQ
jgi:hypothetical protein